MVNIIFDAFVAEWQTVLLFFATKVLFICLTRERPSWHALAVLGIFVSSVTFMDLWRMVDIQTQDDKDLAYEIWATSNHGTFVIASGVVFLFLLWPPKSTDLLAQLLCAILLFSAGWTAIMENLNCNFWQTDIPFDLQTPEQRELSVCERIYGWWYTYVPIAAEIAVMAWITYRWHWARRHLRDA